MTSKAFIPAILTLASAASAQPTSAPPPDPSTWTSSVDVAMYAPCKEWRRNADGSWTYPGTMHVGGASITNITLGHGREAAILDQRCAVPKKR